MKDVYITNSNFDLLLKMFKIHKVDYKFILKEIGNGIDTSYLFSDFEKKEILVKKNLIYFYDKFYSINQIIIEKQNFISSNQDKHKLYNSTPAYHKDPECKFLNKDYKNFNIDPKIDDSLLKEYKNWLITFENLFHNNFKEFGLKHIQKWGKELKFPTYKYIKNSGIKEIEINNIEELEKKIELICNQKIDKRDIENFKKNIKFSSLCKKSNDEILKNIIIKYKQEFEEIHSLKKTFLNSTLTKFIKDSNTDNLKIIDPKYLKNFGFKACSYCNTNSIHI